MLPARVEFGGWERFNLLPGPLSPEWYLRRVAERLSRGVLSHKADVAKHEIREFWGTYVWNDRGVCECGRRCQVST